MGRKRVSRRGVIAGGVAGSVIAALPGGAVQAMVPIVPSNLSSKIDALRDATALVKRLGKQRATFWDDYPPEYYPANVRAGGLMEELFLPPAHCSDDVVAKYAMMEEYYIRETWCRNARDSRGFYGRTMNTLFRRYFDLMDADMARFNVNMHPWWQDSEKAFPRINGQSVRWRDGAWQTFDWAGLKRRAA